MGFQSVLFVVTPEELKEALMPFTLFIGNSHVPVNYTHSPTEDFITNYTSLYEMLCNGEKINYKNNSSILRYFSVTTDIGTIRFGEKHFYQGEYYKTYQGSSRGYAPYFSPFTFSSYAENGKVFVNTKGSWQIDYTDIMGFQLFYPKLTQSEAFEYNITSEKDWESYSDYILFKNYIAKHTFPFNFVMKDIVKKTQIRISAEARKMLPYFYCIKKNDIIVI